MTQRNTENAERAKELAYQTLSVYDAVQEKSEKVQPPLRGSVAADH